MNTHVTSQFPSVLRPPLLQPLISRLSKKVQKLTSRSWTELPSVLRILKSCFWFALLWLMHLAEILYLRQ